MVDLRLRREKIDRTHLDTGIVLLILIEGIVLAFEKAQQTLVISHQDELHHQPDIPLAPLDLPVPLDLGQGNWVSAEMVPTLIEYGIRNGYVIERRTKREKEFVTETTGILHQEVIMVGAQGIEKEACTPPMVQT